MNFYTVGVGRKSYGFVDFCTLKVLHLKSGLAISFTRKKCLECISML